MLAANPVSRIYAIHLASEIYVHPDQVCSLVGRLADRLLAGIDHARHNIAQYLESLPQIECNDRFIFDDDNASSRHRIDSVKFLG